MDEEASLSIPFTQLRTRLSEQELFADKSWRLAPEPFAIPRALWEELTLIGEACMAFHQSLETLYLRAHEGRSLLRNQEYYALWVAEVLDRGKPDDLIAHATSPLLKGAYPPLLRPDLLWTDEGWALTELDSVPGGFGLTTFLQELYEPLFSGFPGTHKEYLERFWKTITKDKKKGESSTVAFVLREEGETYLPEFQFLARIFRAQGYSAYAVMAEELFPMGASLHINVEGNPQKVDVIYRFYELFDLQNMAIRGSLLKAVTEGELEITPPMRPFQEEKMMLALFHHQQLTDFWKQEIPKKLYRILEKIIPRSWILEEALLPPGAYWDGPLIGGNPIWDWNQLAEGSQKERQLILKRSGFSPDSWGARSVLLGNDVSREEWSAGLREALAVSRSSPFVLQDYHKPKRIPFKIYDEAGNIQKMQGRVRICPYYFFDGKQVEPGPVLATVCPADKKIIHGMSVASMVPAYCSE